MGKAQRRKREVEPARERAPAPVRAPARPISISARSVLPLAVLLLVGVAVYANSFSIPFLFDDYFEILKNPEVKALEAPLAYLTRPRGIPTWSLALNYSWGGEEVWGYHLVNLAVHLAATLIVYALVLTILRQPAFGGRYAQRGRLLACLTAVIFAVHPVQTMAVSYIVQRAESIAALFYLLSFLLFVRGESATGWRRVVFYAGMLVTAFLGVVSKQTVVTLPATALAYRVCFGAGAGRVSVPRRALRWAVLVVPAAYAFYLSRFYLLSLDAGASDGSPRAWLFIPTAGFALEGVTPWQYLITQFGVIVWYLRLYVLPTAQCFDYGWPLADSVWRLDVLLPFAFLLLLFACAVAVRRRYPLATFAIAWFFLTLLPSSSIIPLRDAAFEHRLYLSVFGLALLTVVGGFDLAAWCADRFRLNQRMALRAAGAVLLLWLVALAGLTVRRNEVYADPLRLAMDSAAKAPHHWRPHYEVAFELVQRGRPDEAVPFLEEAVRLDPESGSPRIQLAEIYARHGRYDEAIEVAQPATLVEEESVKAAAHRQLGFIYVAQHDYSNALAELEEAATLKPTWASVQRQLAEIYTELGVWYAAAARFNRLLELQPRQPANVRTRAAEVNYRAGVFFLHDNKARGAARLLRTALQYRPNFPEARHYLALCYAAEGEWEKAEAEIDRLAAEKPDDSLVRDNAALIHDRRMPIDPGAPFGPKS